MFFKAGIKILIIAVEIFLGFYSLLISESLLVKFIFFVITAGIIAFFITKIIDKAMPSNVELLEMEGEEEAATAE